VSINAGIGASGGVTGVPVIGPQSQARPVAGTGLPAAAPNVADTPATRPGHQPDAATAPAPPRSGHILQSLRKRSERRASGDDGGDPAGDNPSADLPAPSRRAAQLVYEIAEHLRPQSELLTGLPELLGAGCTPERQDAAPGAQGACSWCGDVASQQRIAAMAQSPEGRRALSMLLLALAIEDHQMRHGDPYAGFNQAACTARRYAQLDCDRAPAWLRPTIERLRHASPEQLSRDLSEQLRQSVTGGLDSLAKAWERCKPLRPARLLRREAPSDDEGSGHAAATEAGSPYLRMRGVLLA
jgi:hypothetical protein